MSMPTSRMPQNTKLALPALTLMTSVLDKTPRCAPAPEEWREARPGSHELAEEDGRKIANYSILRSYHRSGLHTLHPLVPDNLDLDCGDKIRIRYEDAAPDDDDQCPCPAISGGHTQTMKVELGVEQTLTAHMWTARASLVPPRVAELLSSVSPSLSRRLVKKRSYKMSVNPSILQPGPPSVVLCARSAAHKSEAAPRFTDEEIDVCCTFTNPCQSRVSSAQDPSPSIIQKKEIAARWRKPI